MSDEWLCEDQAVGIRLCLKVKERLYEGRTAHQRIEIAATERMGRVLTLDGRFMVSERDEAFYHEMLVHPVLLSHAAPRRILVVGGGDGGALRQVLAHPSVEEAILVEIDPEVIEVARRHLGAVHRGAFDDPRVRVVAAPAEEFVPAHRAAFDALIVDSPDPVGPGAALFTPRFLAACREALQEGGVAAFQAGSPFYDPEELATLVAVLRPLFPYCAPYLGFVPLYPSGLWAYVLAGDRSLDLDDVVLEGRFRARGIVTRYYSPRLHHAAFALPRFVEELVAGGER
ncbi:polyamine aminopropyltransferase [Candidatus Bipolaricaulota bacterium]|nr:polyamine aminopropyltransferase [Candidatus Bipolaricaulota bacterium]